MNIGLAQVKAAPMLPSISKITSGTITPSGQSIKHLPSNKSDFTSSTLLLHQTLPVHMFWKDPKHWKYDCLLSEDKATWILGILGVRSFHKCIIKIDRPQGRPNEKDS